jgi:RNA polymerase sigma-70 factor (ECF subfamily)
LDRLGQLAPATDEALLHSALGGLQEAWAALVERYHGRGLRYVRRHIDDPYLAQDIMQNLWVTLVGAVKRNSPDQFAALFWTLLKRRIIDELRKKGRTREAAILDAPLSGGKAEGEGASLLDHHSSTAPDPLEETVRSENEAILHRALDQLPDHYRLVLIARQLEGRSNKETARLLVAEGLVTDDGNVEKRVENYYYRGLKELKKQLEVLGFTGGGSAA